MANEWREHPRLKGRFLPDYPDDLQVIVHDGGPKVTPNVPEIVWVTVTAMDGDIFRGKVRNQPNNLRTVRQNQEIKLVMPAGNAPAALLEMAAAHLRVHQSPLTGWLAPILVTDKYLRERGAWVIHPCVRCGLTELFDAPSDLMRLLFPNSGANPTMTRFTAPCPQCGGEQRVEARGAPPDAGAADGRGGTYLETLRLQVENMNAIAALLGSITDDNSAGVALAELAKAILRHDELDQKIDSYSLSAEDHMKLAQEQNQDYFAAHSDLTVSMAAAQANAAFARSRAPARAKDIEAAEKKIGLA